MFKRIKEFFTVPLDVPSRNYEVDARWDSDINLWTATFKDVRGNQVGIAGYGPDKKAATLDLHYQNDGVI